ncbi:MAG: DinB family protein [Anaerolineales bacterium]|nr:DinB family protein [Anaerolineales bacterium]QYK50106.1 MAG: DinB family protein [Anaerolineales bacterium]
MNATIEIQAQEVSNMLVQLLEETFNTTQNIYLDKNSSLLATLDTVSAEEASIPVGGKCASLAAQVEHVVFYIESFERYALQGDDTPPDWGNIWRTVEKVTPEEWEASKAKLRSTYERMKNLFANNPMWNQDTIGGALTVIIHSAYHLGEIRQALCVLQK